MGKRGNCLIHTVTMSHIVHANLKATITCKVMQALNEKKKALPLILGFKGRELTIFPTTICKCYFVSSFLQ